MASIFKLRNIFGYSAAGATGAVAIAPEASGRFVGSRITGFFNGMSRGVLNGMLDNPLVAVAGVAAVATLGMKLLTRAR